METEAGAGPGTGGAGPSTGGGGGGGSAAPPTTGAPSSGAPAAPSTSAAPAAPAAAPGGITGNTSSAASDHTAISSPDGNFTLTRDDGKPQRELGETSEGFLARHRTWMDKQTAAEAAGEPKPGEPKPGEPQTDAEKAVAAAAEAAKTTDAAKLAEDAKKLEDAKKAQAAGENDPLVSDTDFESLSPLPTDELSKAIEGDPALKAALDAKPELKEKLFAATRLAGIGAAIAAEFPSVESAKFARETVKTFSGMQEAFTELKPGDIQGTQDFVGKVLLPMSYIYGEDGQVAIDPVTKMPQTDGTVFRFLDNVLSVNLDYTKGEALKKGGAGAVHYLNNSAMGRTMFETYEALAKAIGGDQGEQMQLAIDAIKDVGKAGSSSGAGGEPVVDPRTQQLSEREKAVRAEETRQAQEKQETWKQEVGDSTMKQVTSRLITPLIQMTTLKNESEAVQKFAIQEMEKALYDSLYSDPLYMAQLDQTVNAQGSGLTKKLHDAVVALNVREAKSRFVRTVQPILDQLGARRLSQQAARKQEIATQENKSKSEPVGGTAPSLPKPVATDRHELMRQARENLRTQGKDSDNIGLLLGEFRKLAAQVSTSA